MERKVHHKDCGVLELKVIQVSSSQHENFEDLLLLVMGQSNRVQGHPFISVGGSKGRGTVYFKRKPSILWGACIAQIFLSDRPIKLDDLQKKIKKLKMNLGCLKAHMDDEICTPWLELIVPCFIIFHMPPISFLAFYHQFRSRRVLLINYPGCIAQQLFFFHKFF